MKAKRYIRILLLSLFTLITTKYPLSGKDKRESMAISSSIRPRIIQSDDAPFDFPPIEMYNFPDKDFPITYFGAKDDGYTINTIAISLAIDGCHSVGGGRVVIPKGKWLTGPIHLKSGVNLHLADSAMLIFIDNPEAYLPPVKTSWEGMECYNYSPLIYAYECENIAITGSGILYAEMGTWTEWSGRPKKHMEGLKELYTKASTNVPIENRIMSQKEYNLRPHFIQFNRCKGVELGNFKMRNSPFWTIHLYLCENGWVHNLDVKAHGHNNDGIDLEMSQNIVIEYCTFDQGDDAIVIKAGRNQDGWRINIPSQNIIVRHCVVKKGHCLLGIGSEMSAGVRNVYIHDCIATDQLDRIAYVKTNHRRGGYIENICLERVRGQNTKSVLEIETDVLYQWRNMPTYEERISRIEGVSLKGIECDTVQCIYNLQGDIRLPIRDVWIEDVDVNYISHYIKNALNTEFITEKGVRYKNAP